MLFRSPYSVGQPSLQVLDADGNCVRAVPAVEGCGQRHAELDLLEGTLSDGALRLAFRAPDDAAQTRYTLRVGNDGSPFPQMFELLVRQRNLPAPPPPVVLTPVTPCAPEPASCNVAERTLKPDTPAYFSLTTTEPGQRVQIDMESVELDSYLELRGPIAQGSAFEDSELLATNDDGGNLLPDDSRDDLNARLRHPIAVPGTYAIAARTSGFGAAEGKYRLAVRLLPPPPPAPPPIALQVGKPQAGEFSEEDPTVGLSGPPYHLYSITGRPGETLVIDMVSADLDSLLEAGQQMPVTNITDPLGGEFAVLARDDDGGGERNARLQLRFGGTAPTTLTLRASTFASSTVTGSYTITATPAP